MVAQTVQSDGVQYGVEWVITQRVGWTDCRKRAACVEEAVFIGESTSGDEVREREHLVGPLESPRYFIHCLWDSIFDRESIEG
ncbi:hypothetical protein GCM10009691_25900 [Brevibacterium picturae]|uniref:Uncharacterized protein n=1 Tax=Brevibacterium picturae TaxID=260553 RepID=A0ABN2C1R7_9MICO